MNTDFQKCNDSWQIQIKLWNTMNPLFLPNNSKILIQRFNARFKWQASIKAEKEENAFRRK